MSGEKGLKTITIVTGLSGSGKTTVIKAYKDREAFCIDNMPIVMIPSMIRMFDELYDDVSGFEPPQKVVLGVDCRDVHIETHYEPIKKDLERQGIRLEIIFIEANDNVLIRRFSETRRPHPLAAKGDILSALKEERRMMEPLRDDATAVIDSTHSNVHELRARIFDLTDSWAEERVAPQVTVLSFGFKYGLPLHADLVFDVRFLPNPYFVTELRKKTGENQEVADYVLSSELALKFVDLVTELLKFSLPQYRREGKAYLTVAIGCTGGRHRSVALAIELEKRLNGFEESYPVLLRHRDIER